MGVYTPVADMQAWELFSRKGKVETYLVGSISLDKYVVVSVEQYPVVMRILALLRDGYATEKIQAILLEQGIRTDVEAFCRQLAQKGLLKGDEPPAEQADTPERSGLFGHLRALSWEIFNISLEPLRGTLAGIGDWFLFLLLVGVLASSLAVVLWGDFQWSVLRDVARSCRRGYNVLIALGLNGLVLPFFVLAHEVSHALLASRGHVFPKRLSFRWFLTVPYFSLQLPGLYTLPYAMRLMAIAGGPLADLLLANLSFLIARGTGASWAWLMALMNYSRFVFNLLPVLPMTDGYALLSQGVFREIDIRGRAIREFRRWRQRRANQFRGRYVFFYFFNALVALFILGGALLQINAVATGYLRALHPLQVFPGWVFYVVLAVIDVGCLYLLRKRLRVLLAW